MSEPPAADPPGDPLEWPPERARDLAVRLLDYVDRFAATMAALPVVPAPDPGPGAGREGGTDPLGEPPARGLADADLLAFVDRLFRGSTLVAHPRFLAYITGSGTRADALAAFLAATLNQNVGGATTAPLATEVELRLTAWLARAFGLPTATAGGLMQPGGALANLTALKAARDRAGLACRTAGVRGAQLTVYASEECHASIDRAVDVLGLGMESLRKIPTDGGYALRSDLLAAAIERDLARGLRPMAVVATAGTTSTGSIDPLPACADLCRRHALWLHVDAAYGGAAILAPDLRPRLAGIERADSITFDPHKWLYVSLPASCVLFRSLDLAARSFAVDGTYLAEDGEPVELCDYGPAWSRSFDALKVWFALLAYGTDAFAERIARDAAMVSRLAERLAARPDFELLAPVTLSICCFRYAPPGSSPESRDPLNRAIFTALRADGRFFLSGAELRAGFALRVCVVNHRTMPADLEALVDLVAELGGRLASGPG